MGEVEPKVLPALTLKRLNELDVGSLVWVGSGSGRVLAVIIRRQSPQETMLACLTPEEDQPGPHWAEFSSHTVAVDLGREWFIEIDLDHVAFDPTRVAGQIVLSEGGPAIQLDGQGRIPSQHRLTWSFDAHEVRPESTRVAFSSWTLWRTDTDRRDPRGKPLLRFPSALPATASDAPIE